MALCHLSCFGAISPCLIICTVVSISFCLLMYVAVYCVAPQTKDEPTDDLGMSTCTPTYTVFMKLGAPHEENIQQEEVLEE